MHWVRRWSCSIGSLGLVASSGCTLSADLESLTNGGGKTAEVDAGELGSCREPACAASSVPKSWPDEEATSTGASDSTSARDGGGALIVNDSGDAPPDSSARGELTGSETRAASQEASGPDAGFADDTTRAEGRSSTTDRTSTDQAPATLPEDSSEPDTEQTTQTPALIHRYNFTDTETAVADAVGDADGIVIGTSLERDGNLVFSAGSYVELPASVIAGLDSVTIELWFTSYGTRNWERIFDMGEVEDDSPTSYLFFTSQTPSASGTMRATFRPRGQSESTLSSAEPASDDVEVHVAVVFDAEGDQLALYHDGEFSASAPMPYSLQDMNVSTFWLGRSLFEGDPAFEGEINELRIYDGAIDAGRVRRSFNAGPDALDP